MITSRHIDEREERRKLIESIGGDGKVIWSEIKEDPRRLDKNGCPKRFRYEITDNAILMVKDTEMDFLITKMVARRKRILMFWHEAPEWLLKLADSYQLKQYNEI